MLVLLLSGVQCYASSSAGFHKIEGEKYDDWGICRTRAQGKENGFFQVREEGFRPAIVFESLGERKNRAWELGRKFSKRYRGENCAERIFQYVRDRVAYTKDSVQFGNEEFARNADETAEEIDSRGSARGDCEDQAILLAVMFRAADFRSAVVLAPGHAATLVYMPKYPDANVRWKFKGKKGWIWAEATGRNNPLGWTPQKYKGSELLAYEIDGENIFGGGSSKTARPLGGGGTFFGGSFFSLIFFLWWFPFLGRAVRR